MMLAFVAAAQELPRIDGKNLLDRKVELPQAAAGHPAVLVIGFTHASQHQVKPWAAKLGPLVATWQIAELQDVPRLVRGMVEHGIKSDTPADQRERFVMTFQGEKELKAAAEFSAPDDAYLLVLDGSGTIRWRYHGPLTDPALNEVKNQIAALR
jgi:hypothetical protein